MELAVLHALTKLGGLRAFAFPARLPPHRAPQVGGETRRHGARRGAGSSPRGFERWSSRFSMLSPNSVHSVPSRLRDRRLLPPHHAPELVGKRVSTELAEVVGAHRGVLRDGARGSPCPHQTRCTPCLRVSETAASYHRTTLLNWWGNASTRSSPRCWELTEGF